MRQADRRFSDRWRRWMLAVVLAATGASGTAVGQDLGSLVGRPVTGIRFVVDGVEAPGVALQTLLGLEPGRPLDLAEVRESLARLMALDRFADARAEAVQRTDGLVLSFELVSLRRIDAIRYEGPTGVSRATLDAAITERFGRLPNSTVAPAIAARVEQLCRDRGFTAATVSPRLEPAPRADRTTLLLDMRVGRRAAITALNLGAVAPLTEAEVRQKLGLAVGDDFDPVIFSQRVTAIGDLLRSRGYLESRVAADRRPSTAGDGVAIALTVTPGPRVRVEFRGDPIPPAKQVELVPIQREGSVAEDLLETAARDVEQYLRGLGYRDASVDPSRELSGDTLRIVFRIARGPQYRLGDVELVTDTGARPNGAVISPALRRGDPYVQSRIDAEILRLIEDYHSRGYADVRIVAPEALITRGTGSPGALASIRIVVTEGIRKLVDTVRVESTASIPAAELLAQIQSTRGAPFYPRLIESDREAIRGACIDRGYQTAEVEARTSEAGPGRVTLVFAVHEGPLVTVDHILISGNSRIATATIERQLAMRRGDPLSPVALAETRRRLAVMGLFRQVRVAELARGSGTRRDVLIVVDESPASTFGYGFGLEGGKRAQHSLANGGTATEGIEIVPRGFIEIGRRNLWGKNRSANFFARASVRRRDAVVAAVDGTTPEGSQASGGGLDFREYRLLGTYRESGVFGVNNEAVVGAYSELTIRTSYTFSRRGVTAELAHRLGPSLSLSGRYSLDHSRLVQAQLKPDDQLSIDRLFPQIRLSSASVNVVRDTRSDAIEPTRGALLSFDTEVAARRLLSQVGFVRTYTQGFVYRRLPGSARFVFAGGARLGLSVGFTREVLTLPDGQPILSAGGTPIVVTVKDVPAARRFFAGGDTTNRAFVADRLGAPDTLDPKGDSRGGRAMLLLNGELRATVNQWLVAVGFLDVGNVFARAEDVRFGDLRPGVGGGARVKTPLGMFRFDVGLKLNQYTFQNGTRESRWAFNFGFGQAF